MENKKKSIGGFFSGLVKQQAFIPLAALLILALFNLIMDPSFFKVTLGYNSVGEDI